MDGVNDLIARAQAAGLRLAIEGDRLVVRGPRQAAALAHVVLAHKVAVVQALRACAAAAAMREVCPRCAALHAAAPAVLEALRPFLPVALQRLDDARLLTLTELALMAAYSRWEREVTGRGCDAATGREPA